MGRKSTKENKNLYQLAREEAGLTREAAARALFISEDRIARIEGGKLPHPDEALLMAQQYRSPMLCTRYCREECPIGKKDGQSVELKSLAQITVETLAALNRLSNAKERLVEITVDGKISPDEAADFSAITADLNDLELAVRALRLWVENEVATGAMPADLLTAPGE